MNVEDDASNNVLSTLAYISKALKHIFEFSDSDDLKLIGVNNFMNKKHEAAKSYLLKIIDVMDADQYLHVNNRQFSIVIKMKQIVFLILL